MFEIVGIKEVNFKAKDGGDVHGVSLHCIDHGNLLDSGAAVEKFFLPASKGFSRGDYCVGDMVDIVYNKYGKIANATVVEPNNAQ